jgi:hypothetical protein
MENPEIFPVRTLPEVEDIIRGVMDVLANYSSIHPFIVRASIESEEFRDALEELNEPFMEIMERKLREHLAKGFCRDLDPAVTARILVNLLEYTNLWWQNQAQPIDRDALIHNLSVIFYSTLNQEG